MNKSVSPSRTYIAMCSGRSGPGSVGYHFKKFSLPETDAGILEDQESTTLENDSHTAAWYYLNRLDMFDVIDGCISFEDVINDIVNELPAKKDKDNLLIELLEARKLLNTIKHDVINGQISDITKDIDTFFEKYFCQV